MILTLKEFDEKCMLHGAGVAAKSAEYDIRPDNTVLIDGVIHTINGEKKPIDFSVGEVVVVIENTQANLIAEVSAYRDDLRVWAGEMKKQKLIGDEQLKKLAEQLACLPKK